MRLPTRTLLWALIGSGFLCAPRLQAEDLPEYRLKAAVVYNFMVYTEWPGETGNTLNLCIYGADPFGLEIDGLQGKVVAGRSIAVHRKAAGESLTTCQVVFISSSTMSGLSGVLERLRGHAVLTVADSPGAARQGVMLNMAIVRAKVTFEANLQAARSVGIVVSSKLLRLATEVRQ